MVVQYIPMSFLVHSYCKHAVFDELLMARTRASVSENSEFVIKRNWKTKYHKVCNDIVDEIDNLP